MKIGILPISTEKVQVTYYNDKQNTKKVTVFSHRILKTDKKIVWKNTRTFIIENESERISKNNANQKQRSFKSQSRNMPILIFRSSHMF